MEITKGLIQKRIDRLGIDIASYQDELDRHAALKPMGRTPTWTELCDSGRERSQFKEAQKARIEACKNEIDDLTLEYQALLRMEIEVGLPAAVASSGSKGRL
jgi:hypothetical protein